MNLESSTQKVWKIVTQIIHFQMWNKRTFEWIITSSIKDWTFTKMMTTDWRMIMVNWNNVDCIEVFNSET
jgi:hypothetical protein